MIPLPIASLLDSRLWYAVPLIVSISLVYAATRHEWMGPILYHACQTARWIVGFLLIGLVVLWLCSWWL